MIEDHQDLLEKYISSEKGIISEYSGSITADLNELERDVRDYCDRTGLRFPEESFAPYLRDGE